MKFDAFDKGGLFATGGTGGGVEINGESYQPEPGGCLKVADGKVVH